MAQTKELPTKPYQTVVGLTLHSQPVSASTPRVKVLPDQRIDVSQVKTYYNYNDAELALTEAELRECFTFNDLAERWQFNSSQVSDDGATWGATPGGWCKLKRANTETFDAQPQPVWFMTPCDGRHGAPKWTQVDAATNVALERALSDSDVEVTLAGVGTFQPIMDHNGSILRSKNDNYNTYAIRREPPPPKKTGMLTEAMYDVLETPPKDSTCHICLDEFEEDDTCVALNLCKHTYHDDCLKQWFDKGKPTCPYCSKSYDVLLGPQPPGRMTVRRNQWSCDGYDCGTIEVIWEIYGGIQTEKHQNPGVPFYGDSRTGYLPDNAEGQEILRLFELAWERRQMFSVGMSVTRGVSNVVVWNGIHAKTNTRGGSSYYGYPDPDYFARVKEELAAKGIVEESAS